MTQVTGNLYKVRKFSNGRNKQGKVFNNYSLTVPSVIANQLEGDLLFSCELTDEGILYKPVSADEVVDLPKWATNGKKARARKRKPMPLPNLDEVTK